jgi:hypothetical protein
VGEEVIQVNLRFNQYNPEQKMTSFTYILALEGVRCSLSSAIVARSKSCNLRVLSRLEDTCLPSSVEGFLSKQLGSRSRTCNSMTYHLQSDIVHVLDAGVVKLCSLDLVFGNLAGPRKGSKGEDNTSNEHYEMLLEKRVDGEMLRRDTQQLDITSLYSILSIWR